MATAGILSQFVPNTYYINILNNDQPVQGAILNRRNITPNEMWLTVTDLTLDTMTINVPDLSEPLTIPCDVHPRFAIQMARAKQNGVTPKKRKSSGKPRKTTNYADLVSRSVLVNCGSNMQVLEVA